jgi:hypothetical protein
MEIAEADRQAANGREEKKAVGGSGSFRAG